MGFKERYPYGTIMDKSWATIIYLVGLSLLSKSTVSQDLWAQMPALF